MINKGETGRETSARKALRARLDGTNINSRSFLATDFLNHYNEAYMLLEMTMDMPEMLEELDDWGILSYVQHFRESNLPQADLAIQCYHLSPPEYRSAFDRVVANLDQIVLDTLDDARSAVADGIPEQLAVTVTIGIRTMRRLLETLNSIINGESALLSQEAIDNLIEEERSLARTA